MCHRYSLDEDERPSDGVVFAMAEVIGQRATDLEPLVETVDPDALDRLFATDRRREVTFRYLGRTVTVGDGAVEISESAAGET
jgi:hypothetical protein